MNSSSLRHGITTAVLGAVGFLASFILVLERLAVYEDANHKSACDIGDLFSCTSITQTWQASLFGFPNPLIGIVAFTVAILLGVLIASGLSLPKWIHLSFLAGLMLGGVFIAWLVYQAVFSIGLLCLYCMAVWTVVTFMLAFTVKHLMVNKVLFPNMDDGKRFALADWLWLVACLVLVVIAALVVFVLVL